MSSPDDAIQPADAPTAPPPGEERIPLAPIPATPAPDPAPFINRLVFLDGILVFLLLAFAFVLNTNIVTNSDVLMHLAAGRLVADGQFSYADPFSFTSSGWWINHSWLFDLLLYGFYSLTGPEGVGLSLLKGFVFTMVAWLMVRAASKPDERSWIPVVVTALGVLTFAPRNLLNPTMISTLLLAALMLVLVRHTPGSRTIWTAPLLCLLWVNCSPWFFLGPLFVLFFLLGRAIQSNQEQGEESDKLRAELPLLGRVFFGCLAACFLNPYFTWAFTALPPELQRFGSGGLLVADPIFRSLWLSPVQGDYFSPNFGLSPAGLAFFPLALLGLVSFGLTLDRIQWWRALVFIATLVLALTSARTVPFFAVVSVIVTSLNFLEASERYLGAQAYLTDTWRAWAISGRALTMVILFALALVALPGWLQAQPQARYRFAVGLRLDEGMTQTAQQVASWQKEGLITPGQKWLNLSPEVANYFAWFCPDQKCFIDHRVVPFSTETAQEFLSVRKAFQGEYGPEDQEARFWWRLLLARHQIRFVAFHYPNLALAEPTLIRLYDRHEWAPCHVAGKAALFAWKPRGGQPQGLPELPPAIVLSFDRLAFGPDALPAPGSRPEELVRSWTSLLLEGDLASPWQADTARQHLIRFDQQRGSYFEAIDAMLSAQVAADAIGPSLLPSLLAPAPAGAPFLVGAEKLFSPNLTAQGNIAFPFFDRGPSSSLYLAVRAARHALAVNPEDPRSLLLLSAAYHRLLSDTNETALEAQNYPHVSLIRRTQIAAPLAKIIRLNPTDLRYQLEAHERLMDLYRDPRSQQRRPHPRFLDLYVHHQKESLRLAREAPAHLRGRGEDIGKLIEAATKDYQNNQKILQEQMARLDESSIGRPLTQKVAMALQLGLPGEALRLMKGASPEDLRPPVLNNLSGTYFYLDLLLLTGEVEDVRNTLLPPGQADKVNPAAFGPHPAGGRAFDIFLLQVMAAEGDYDEADKKLNGMIEEMQSAPDGLQMLVSLDVLPRDFPLAPDPDNLSKTVGLGVGSFLLQVSQAGLRTPWNMILYSPVMLHPPHRLRTAGPAQLEAAIRQYAGQALSFQGDLSALRGYLALEQGRTADARRFAERCLQYGGEDKGRHYSGLRSALPARFLLRRLELAAPDNPYPDAITP